MAPPAKRARLHTGSSSPAGGQPLPTSSPAKGSARRPLGSHQLQLPLPPSPLKRSTLQPADDQDGQDPLANPVPRHSNSFITSSTGDAYLLASASPSKTSDNLLSSHLPHGPFTFDSYSSALSAFDSHPHLTSQRAALALNSTTYDSKYFDKWLWEMEQGFNVLLHGFGSKRELIMRFGDRARKKGEVVVVEGFDSQCGLGDVVSVMEEIVKRWEREDEGSKAGGKRAGTSPKKGSPKKAVGASPRKGKGKATATNEDDFTTSLPVLPPSLSALESRIRRLLHSLTLHKSSLSPSPKPRPPIYLLLHSLDGPTLRLPKTLSLLALLAAQPRIHVLASVDHLRAAMLFSGGLLNTRAQGSGGYKPTTKLGGGAGGAGGGSAQTSPEGTPAPAQEEEPPITNYHLRTFTFLPYHVPTLLPYSTETLHASTLSTLLPSSIFPSQPSSTDRSTESLKQSVGHVLDSVTERAKRVFGALAGLMLEEYEGEWTMGKGSGGQAPGCAVRLEVFKNHCTDRLLAAHNDQVDALLSEFRDHGVVRGSLIAPAEEEDGDGDGDGEGAGEEWVWIPLERASLEEVLGEMEG